VQVAITPLGGGGYCYGSAPSILESKALAKGHQPTDTNAAHPSLAGGWDLQAPRSSFCWLAAHGIECCGVRITRRSQWH